MSAPTGKDVRESLLNSQGVRMQEVLLSTGKRRLKQVADGSSRHRSGRSGAAVLWIAET